MASVIGTETGAMVAAPSTARDGARGVGLANARAVVLPVGFALLVLGLWQAACVFGRIPAVILPSPLSTFRYIVERWDILLTHAIPTTVESALGFLLASLLGVALAVVITSSRLAREALYPNLVFFQLIPKIALAPLFIVWLGIGSASRLTFSVFIAFFPVVIATLAGLEGVDRDLLRLCRSVGATPWRTYLHVRFPAAVPHIFAGSKIAVTFAMIGVIVGEFITAQAGLGYMILFAASQADMALIFASIALLCVIGLVLYGLTVGAERLALRRYGA